MDEPKKFPWLYGVIALLLLALVIETGFLVSKSILKAEEKTYSRRSIVPDSYAPQPIPYRIPQRPRRAAPVPSFFDEEWDPFQEMQRMQERMNRIFNESFGRVMRSSPSWSSITTFSPAVDLEEKQDAYIVRADLPGLEKDTIQVSVSGNVLTIGGERKEETEKEDTQAGFYESERSYGSFSRSLTLPGLVDESKVTADYKNGVLVVTLPKAQGSDAQERRVTIT